MASKVHPLIQRIPFIFPWDSRWFAKKEQFPLYLKQEVKIRQYLQKKLRDAGIDSISLERTTKELTVTILAAKPGVVIGRSGQGLEVIRKELEKNFLQFKLKVKLNIQAVSQPALSASIVAENAAIEIEKRLPFRKVMKQTIQKTMTAGAKGIKIRMSGRLNGAEIARTEKLAAGKMSLITLRSQVDYALAEANTIYGKIGIKVWIYHGEAFGRQDKFDFQNKEDSEQSDKKNYRKN